jgi:hypothetical protein
VRGEERKVTFAGPFFSPTTPSSSRQSEHPATGLAFAFLSEQQQDFPPSSVRPEAAIPSQQQPLPAHSVGNLDERRHLDEAQMISDSGEPAMPPVLSCPVDDREFSSAPDEEAERICLVERNQALSEPIMVEEASPSRETFCEDEKQPISPTDTEQADIDYEDDLYYEFEDEDDTPVEYIDLVFDEFCTTSYESKDDDKVLSSPPETAVVPPSEPSPQLDPELNSDKLPPDRPLSSKLSQESDPFFLPLANDATEALLLHPSPPTGAALPSGPSTDCHVPNPRHLQDLRSEDPQQSSTTLCETRPSHPNPPLVYQPPAEQRPGDKGKIGKGNSLSPLSFQLQQQQLSSYGPLPVHSPAAVGQLLFISEESQWFLAISSTETKSVSDSPLGTSSTALFPEDTSQPLDLVTPSRPPPWPPPAYMQPQQQPDYRT